MKMTGFIWQQLVSFSNGLSGQTPASAKHMLLEKDSLEIRRSMIFEENQPDEEMDAGLGNATLELVGRILGP